jgi:hypothetical protein
MPLMFLNGTAMSGQPDHGAVEGAPLVGAVRTAPQYRFFAIRDEATHQAAATAARRSFDGLRREETGTGFTVTEIPLMPTSASASGTGSGSPE